MRAIIAVVLLLSGCATGVGGQRLTQAEWRAADVNGVPVVAPAPTLRLDGDGGVSGSTGCNTYSGAYRLMSDQRIAFEGIGGTERACEPALMAQERNYLSILQNARGYSFYRDGGLSLIAPDGRALRFRPL